MTEAERVKNREYVREWYKRGENAKRAYQAAQAERHRRIAAGGKTPEDVQIGINVYRSREILGLSGPQLADAAGLTYNTIYNVERGLVTPKVDTMKKIRRALRKTALERINVLAKIARGEDL